MHLTFEPLDLDVVEQAELDDVHPELGILDEAEGLDRRLRARSARPQDQ